MCLILALRESLLTDSEISNTYLPHLHKHIAHVQMIMQNSKCSTIRKCLTPLSPSAFIQPSSRRVTVVVFIMMSFTKLLKKGAKVARSREALCSENETGPSKMSEPSKVWQWLIVVKVLRHILGAAVANFCKQTQNFKAVYIIYSSSRTGSAYSRRISRAFVFYCI